MNTYVFTFAQTTRTKDQRYSTRLFIWRNPDEQNPPKVFEDAEAIHLFNRLRESGYSQSQLAFLYIKETENA